MPYGVGHSSSTRDSKCVICRRVTSTYLTIANYSSQSDKTLDTKMEIPVCDGEHYDLVATQKEILIGHAKTINTHLRKLGKQEG